jgi:DNA-binding transcriptional LysR family regulator
LRHALIAPRGLPGGAVDEALAKVGLTRRVVLGVPHFSAAPFVVAKSNLVLTVPERVAHLFSAALQLQVVEPPVPVPGFAMYLFWHQRHHLDPAHVWLRTQIIAAANALSAKAKALR